VINVLDTGAPNRGSDVLIVQRHRQGPAAATEPTGDAQCPTDDIFLLRALELHRLVPGAGAVQANESPTTRRSWRCSHGNFGTVTPVAATTGHRPDALLRQRRTARSAGQR
jgi:hypothetical protein